MTIKGIPEPGYPYGVTITPHPFIYNVITLNGAQLPTHSMGYVKSRVRSHKKGPKKRSIGFKTKEE